MTLLGVSLSEIEYFVQMLISPDDVSASNDRNLSNLKYLYTETIYRYSQSKAMRLLSSPIFKLVFTHFLSNGEYDSFAKQDSTIQKHPEHYKSVATWFISLMNDMHSTNC